ncbi:carbonic anhydrase 4a [Clarias gariepinus]|uniref:carbonic anhydrase 4a n=1 Tax=Clarias gariepinus TaxID=13013 RepID=UPI00234CDE4C|nr:carbonic anhydrase 4a [Clarias gariepinus]
MYVRVSGLLLFASFWSVRTGAEHWCYQSQVTCETPCKGPDDWHELYEDCKEKEQSPINIVTGKTVLDDKLTPFIFKGYQEAFTGILKNNGHTVKVSVPFSATVSGGDLRDTYKAVQFHLHWGQNGGPGSEHTIDGEQYPMELHIVHMKERFKTLEDALKERHGVAVLGFFYEESKSENKKYNKLIQALEEVQNANENTTVSGISLNNLILSEENMTRYYRYDGSLTTPGCTEGVVWTVFEHPIPLSKEQLKAFSNLKFHDGKDMVKTFRPVQPRYDRIVYRSDSTVVMLSFTLLLVCLCSVLGFSQRY